GYPIHVCELLKETAGVAYLERVTVNSPNEVRKTKKALKKAFTAQVKRLGFSMVEVLSTCPTNWGMSPKEAMKWLDDNMKKEYPVGVFVDKVGDEK
ncbi:MAG: 2-oxoglutarate oxidoreductase, partial [Petrotogales bacterium]